MEVAAKMPAKTTAPTEVMSAREISKKRHEARLMEASKQAISQYGIRGATIDRIQEISGLSRGLINTRFQTKDNLLEETVRAMSETYTQNWKEALELAGQDPASKLRALIDSDFSEQTLNAPNMALWFAFRSEAKSRVRYLDMISSRGKMFTQELYALCDQLSESEGTPIAEGRNAANVLMATLEGLWTDFHLFPDDFDRQAAIALCWNMMQRYFPRHLPNLKASPLS